jgi:proteic killer suppression protein
MSWTLILKSISYLKPAGKNRFIFQYTANPTQNLEILKGNLKGYYSIRVNDQWRIIFKWSESGADNVSIIDYH